MVHSCRSALLDALRMADSGFSVSTAAPKANPRTTYPRDGDGAGRKGRHGRDSQSVNDGGGELHGLPTVSMVWWPPVDANIIIFDRFVAFEKADACACPMYVRG